MEEINLDKLNFSEPPSVNFGGGIELLMNDRKKQDNNMDEPNNFI